MIKCNVTACGTISSSAEEKQSKDGEKFISFGMIVPLLGKDGTAKEVWVTVSGVMYIRKHDGNIYLNLRTDSNIEVNESTTNDRLEGSMEFRGKVSKKGIKELKDKKGKDFQSFAAFSSDKEGENREFTWVSFVNFSPIHEDYFAAEKYVEVHGDLQLGIFKGELQIECKVKSIAAWDLNKTADANGTAQTAQS